LDGTGRLRSLPAFEVSSSGVADPGRESPVRGRPAPAFVVVMDLDWAAACFDGALVVTVVFFFSGFSGAGHSTSCERSMRSAVIHSV
jgi:hypothetical protein